MSDNLSLCQISPDLKERLKKFRFHKSDKDEEEVRGLLMKIEKTTSEIVFEEELKDSFENLIEELPSNTQPRYLLLIKVKKDDDGRKSFPLELVFCSPAGSTMELQFLYTCSLKELQKETRPGKTTEVREWEELLEE